MLHFAFLPAVYEGSSVSTTSPILNSQSFYNSHSGECVVGFHHGFNLNFPNNFLLAFFVFIFDDVLIQIFAHLFWGGVLFVFPFEWHCPTVAVTE